MRKTILPNSVLVVYSVGETFEDGYQDLHVGTYVGPSIMLDKLTETVDKVNSGGFSEVNDGHYLKTFFNVSHGNDMEIRLIQIYETDHIGRFSFE